MVNIEIVIITKYHMTTIKKLIIPVWESPRPVETGGGQKEALPPLDPIVAPLSFFSEDGNF